MLGEEGEGESMSNSTHYFFCEYISFYLHPTSHLLYTLRVFCEY